MADVGFQNILDHEGIAIAVTGMLIVFIALVLISIFIALLPKILDALSFIIPPPPEPAAALQPSTSDDDQVAAAIGFVFHQREIQKQKTSK